MDHSKKQKDNLEEGSLDDLLSAIRHIVSTPPHTHPEDSQPVEIIDLKRPLPDLDAYGAHPASQDKHSFSQAYASSYSQEDEMDSLSERVQEDLRTSFEDFSQRQPEIKDSKDDVLKDLFSKALENFFQVHKESFIKDALYDFLHKDENLKKMMRQMAIAWLEDHMADLVRTIVKEHLKKLSSSR